MKGKQSQEQLPILVDETVLKVTNKGGGIKALPQD